MLTLLHASDLSGQMCDHYFSDINCTYFSDINCHHCGPVQTGNYSRRAPTPKYVTAFKIYQEKLLIIAITL